MNEAREQFEVFHLKVFPLEVEKIPLKEDVLLSYSLQVLSQTIISGFILSYVNKFLLSAFDLYLSGNKAFDLCLSGNKREVTR